MVASLIFSVSVLACILLNLLSESQAEFSYRHKKSRDDSLTHLGVYKSESRGGCDEKVVSFRFSYVVDLINHGLQGLLDRFTLPEDEETGSRQVSMEQRYAAETFGYQDADRSEQDMLPHVPPDRVIDLDDREFGKY